MNYDEYYKQNSNVFGSGSEKILRENIHKIQAGKYVLDIGAGQGRNSIYLAENGFIVDAIDPSAVSIQFIENISKEKNLKINAVQISFDDFESENKYAAILVFGLIQILSYEEIEILKNKINELLMPGGLIFLTAFTTEDDSFDFIKISAEKLERNSFRRADGEIRTFLEPGELKSFFAEFETVFYWEGSGPVHRHGDSPPEKHAMVEAVFRKQ